MNIAFIQGNLILLGIAAILLTSLGFAFKEAVSHASKKVSYLIVLLRTLALIAVMGLLIRPYYLESIPDKDSFSIAVLADVSGSMQTIDAPQTKSRIEIMKSMLDTQSADSIVAAFGDRYAFTIKTFAEQVQPLTARYEQLPKENKATAISDALLNIVKAPGLNKRPLAGVILMTDGNGNMGSDIQLAIERFRKESIPVTTIGIGDSVEQDGISVRFEEKKVKTILGTKTALDLVVFNQSPEKKVVKLALVHRKKRIDILSTELPAHEETSLSFSITPEYAGIEPYTVTIETIDGIDTNSDDDSNGDSNSDSISDSVMVYSERSEKRRVLYISDQLSMDYRFFKQSLAGEENMELSSLIRLADNKFYQYGEDLPAAYPENANFWFDFDVVLMNSNVLTHLSKNLLKGLHDFVNKRGGGLLLFGPIETMLSEDESTLSALEGLLPGKNTEILSLQGAHTAQVGWQLLDAPTQSYSPEISMGTQIQRLMENNIAVRTLAWGRQDQTGETVPILQVQSYGAGKSVYWSLPDGWRWSIAGTASHQVFEKFWRHLVFWLGGGALERMSFPEDRYFFPIEEPAQLRVDITETDFSPATNAMVEAVIEHADGKQRVPLLPDPKVPGRYVANYRTSTAGTQEVNYQAILGNGDSGNSEVLQRQTLMVFDFNKIENTENAFKPEILKELAYATKGIYYHYSDIAGDPESIDIATIEQLPELQVRHYLTDNIFYLLGVLILLGGEWILRRRWGLH